MKSGFVTQIQSDPMYVENHEFFTKSNALIQRYEAAGDDEKKKIEQERQALTNPYFEIIPLKDIPIHIEAEHLTEDGFLDKSLTEKVGIRKYGNYSVLVYKKVIGQGGNGKIKLGQIANVLDAKTNNPPLKPTDFIAIKNLKVTVSHSYTREIINLGAEKKLIGVTDIPTKKNDAKFKTSIAMQYEGDFNLYHFINRNLFASYSYLHKMQFIRNTVIALDFFHKQADPKVHRDVKPENFQIDLITGKVTLVDLAVTLAIPRGGFITVDDNTGTLSYRAPELGSNNGSKPKTYTTKTDIYALGLTLGELLDFINCEDNDPRRKMKPWKEIETQKQPILPLDVLKILYDLIATMLDELPKNRPSTYQTLTKIDGIVTKQTWKNPTPKKVIFKYEPSDSISPTELDGLVRSLRNFDEVFLELDDPKNVWIYSKFAKRLLLRGINVVNLVQGPLLSEGDPNPTDKNKIKIDNASGIFYLTPQEPAIHSATNLFCDINPLAKTIKSLFELDEHLKLIKQDKIKKSISDETCDEMIKLSLEVRKTMQKPEKFSLYQNDPIYLHKLAVLRKQIELFINSHDRSYLKLITKSFNEIKGYQGYVVEEKQPDVVTADIVESNNCPKPTFELVTSVLESEINRMRRVRNLLSNKDTSEIAQYNNKIMALVARQKEIETKYASENLFKADLVSMLDQAQNEMHHVNKFKRKIASWFSCITLFQSKSAQNLSALNENISQHRFRHRKIGAARSNSDS